MSNPNDHNYYDVFYPLSNSVESFIVEYYPYGFDHLVVIYNNEEYTLEWVDKYSYYRGVVGDIEGYIV